jgi:hypothetical protein
MPTRDERAKKVSLLEAMTTKLGREIMARVEAALSETEGRTPRTVYAQIGIGSLATVYRCFALLRAEGRVRYEGPNSFRLYFRVTGVTEVGQRE